MTYSNRYPTSPPVAVPLGPPTDSPAGLADPYRVVAPGASGQDQGVDEEGSTAGSLEEHWWKPVAVGALVSGVLVALFALVVVGWLGLRPPSVADAPIIIQPASGGAGAGEVAGVLEKVGPSVVTVHVTSALGEGAGTGFIYSSDGLVVTNAHVVAGAELVSVDLSDGRSFDVEVLQVVPDADIAVLSLQGDFGELQAAELGSSEQLMVGTPVVAIGNALDFGGTPSVTTGIISAKDRTLHAEDGTALYGLLQTDAAINPGNSGGPLVDLNGRIVGVNTAIIAEAQNMGFALAIDQVHAVVEQVVQGKEVVVERATIGVNIYSVGAMDRETLDAHAVSVTSGAFIENVVEGSGAETAGLRGGDVIVGIDGQVVRDHDDVSRIVLSHQRGDVLTVHIERHGEALEIPVTVG